MKELHNVTKTMGKVQSSDFAYSNYLLFSVCMCSYLPQHIYTFLFVVNIISIYFYSIFCLKRHFVERAFPDKRTYILKSSPPHEHKCFSICFIGSVSDLAGSSHGHKGQNCSVGPLSWRFCCSIYSYQLFCH